MKGYYVYYGEEKYPFEIPSGWTVLQNAVSEEAEISLTIPEMVEKALAAPISSPRLSEIVHEDSKVALIVDDWARSTPVSQILPTLLEELQSGGAKSENIDIVVALGTHRAMPQEALAERLGEAVFQQYRVSQHDCQAEDLVPIGRLSTGGEVKINPIVAQADVKIGVGSIVPHPMNGFGGGAKIIMPGVANYEAVKEHHLHFTPQPGCYIGNLESNPFYQEVCRVAEMAQLTFIVNCVYNSREEVVDVVAGHFQKAHLAGIERSKENYAFRLDEPADVTITSAYPYVEAAQTIKPIVPASLLATKPGGSVIIVVTCRDEMPEPLLAALDAVYSRHPEHTGRLAVETFKSSQLFVEGAIDFNCAIFYALVCAARSSVTMVSRDLDERSITRLGFRYASSLEEAIERESRMRPQATVNIFPIGGTVLPLTKEPPMYE
ncbi:MAG: nickel-dependent lactate racemase [Anaerolineae bacterium]|nr:nickel-dependent lactate racemase [Anaerolineae bacterium]